MIYDPAALDLLAHQVLNCVCAELNRVAGENEDLAQPGCPCRSFVIAGAAPLDTCCGTCSQTDADQGQLTVSVSALYPTVRFPVPDRTIDLCQPYKLTTELTITMLRCEPKPDSRGNPPTPEAWETAARILHTDMLTIEHAVTCCANTDTNGKKRKVAVLSHRVLSPAGCRGSELVIALDTGINCCPEVIS